MRGGVKKRYVRKPEVDVRFGHSPDWHGIAVEIGGCAAGAAPCIFRCVVAGWTIVVVTGSGAFFGHIAFILRTVLLARIVTLYYLNKAPYNLLCLDESQTMPILRQLRGRRQELTADLSVNLIGGQPPGAFQRGIEDSIVLAVVLQYRHEMFAAPVRHGRNGQLAPRDAFHRH